MTLQRKRDRDGVGTSIPLIVEAARGQKRDGIVTRYVQDIDEEAGTAHELKDIRVKMVPFEALSALLSIKGKELRSGMRWHLEVDKRLELVALHTLVQGVAMKDNDSIHTYIQLKSAHLRMDETLRTLNNWTHQRRREIARLSAENAFRTIGNALNSMLQGVQFVIWWVDEQRHFSPGLLCGNLETAVAALLVSRITRSQNFAVCGLPNCRNEFIRVKTNNHYCSRKCGDTHRKQKQRAREKAQLAKQRRAGGTKKAR